MEKVIQPAILEHRSGKELDLHHHDESLVTNKAIEVTIFCPKAKRIIVEYIRHSKLGFLVQLVIVAKEKVVNKHSLTSGARTYFILEGVNKEALIQNYMFTTFARELLGINPRFLAHLIFEIAP